MKKLYENGLTLIALVVTIIILLILAGISLGMVTSDNGIIGRSKNAVNLYRESATKENGILNNYASAIEKARNDSSKVSKSTSYGSQSSGDILKYLPSMVADGWFLPSLKEWIAFEGEVIKSARTYSFGLQWGYWTSTQASTSNVWDIYPGSGKHEASVTNSDYVRLSKTF